MNEEIRAHFLAQAKACQSLGSPFTARVCRLIPAALDVHTSLGRRVGNWPGDPRSDALALRLCGGLLYLTLSAQDQALRAVYPPAEPDDAALGAALAAALLRHSEFLDSFIDSPPQTNEVARAGMLLPGFLVIARETGLPLDIAEIGASAGLNMLFDQFAYSYAGESWGYPQSPVHLLPELRGELRPRLDQRIGIGRRSGCDIAPVDLSDQAARLRLQSYVWPDQALRLQRLRGALELAAIDPPQVERADASEFVERLFAARPDGTALVLFHSIMWQYMPQVTRNTIEQSLRLAGSKADAETPLAWLRMEPDDTSASHAMLTLTLWPGGQTRKLAHCDYHGRWIEWIDPATG